MTTAAARAIAREVLAERARQDAKWGEQNHPDGTGPYSEPLHFVGGSWFNPGASIPTPHAELLRSAATDDTDTHAQEPEHYGPVTWTAILLEEVFEALAADDAAGVRAELVQVAAVAEQWIEAIDRRSPDPMRRVRIRRFLPAHAYLAFLLSETAGATHTRLERLWAAKSARAGALAWPFISGSGLRTRVSELVRWGIVEWSGEWGRTVANRPAKVWRLADDASRLEAIADGSIEPIPGYEPGVRDVFLQLREQAGTDVVTIAALEAVASAAGVRL